MPRTSISAPPCHSFWSAPVSLPGSYRFRANRIACSPAYPLQAPFRGLRATCGAIRNLEGP
eukprot:15463122-Alexandrium_andersonii.AAC.1